MRVLIFCTIAVLFGSCDKNSNPLSSSGSNGQQVGASSRDLLSATNYTTLKIELDYMPGMRPTANTINNIKAFLTGVSNKPAGIEVMLTEIPSAGKSAYSLTDIQAIEAAERSQFTGGNVIGAYLLFVDGNYSQGNVVGIAYKNTSMCIFGKTIQDNSGGLLMPSTEKLETTVVEHEFGHILGLVDIGSPMQVNHKDSQNGSHCSNEACLMYFQVETTDALANLVNGPVPGLDQNCRNDLKANGGK